MTSRRSLKGFSLLELLIVIAVIGIVAAVGLPAYRSYIATANMGKTSTAYEYAIRFVRQEFSNNITRDAIGITSSLPLNNEGWIALLNRGDRGLAPNGGPAYVSRLGAGSATDIDTTGAVAISYDNEKRIIKIFRPSYLELKGFVATIDSDSIDIQPN